MDPGLLAGTRVTRAHSNIFGETRETSRYLRTPQGCKRLLKFYPLGCNDYLFIFASCIKSCSVCREVKIIVIDNNRL